MSDRVSHRRFSTRKMILLSIITPVYNGERFMEYCIKNVINQNCSKCEHIIIDGGSTDGTVDIVRRYAAVYRHIRWISEKDLGQSDAMNKGISLARGVVLGFLNVDDYYEPSTLGPVLDRFNELSEPSLLVGNCNVWDDDGRLLFVSAPSKISLSSILLGNFEEAFPMNPSGYFYHRSLHDIIGPYNVDEHYAMDLDFILRAVRVANVVYHNATWGNYRYLRGTKTFRDDANGSNSERVTSITLAYLEKLPAIKRFSIRTIGIFKGRCRRLHAILKRMSKRSLS